MPFTWNPSKRIVVASKVINTINIGLYIRFAKYASHAKYRTNSMKPKLLT